MEELKQERRSREEERRTEDEERRRNEEELHQELQRSQQQEALQLSQAKAELQLMAERNAGLQEEVCVCVCVSPYCCVQIVLTRIWKTEKCLMLQQREDCISLMYSTGLLLCQQTWIKFSRCVSVRVWSQQNGREKVLDGEGGWETETDRVHVCFGRRVRSDGFLCQHRPNGAELKSETKSEKRGEAVHRGSRMRHTYEEPGGRKQ